MQQTAEAQQAGLVLENVYDVQPIVVAAQEERVLNTRHLNAVASTLDAAESLRQQLGVASVVRDRQADASSMNGASSGERQLQHGWHAACLHAASNFCMSATAHRCQMCSTVAVCPQSMPCVSDS